jgi:hypothetical protein
VQYFISDDGNDSQFKVYFQHEHIDTVEWAYPAIVHLVHPMVVEAQSEESLIPLSSVTVAVADMLTQPIRDLVPRLREVDESLVYEGDSLTSRVLTLEGWDQQGGDDAEEEEETVRDDHGIVRQTWGNNRCFATVLWAPRLMHGVQGST